MIYKFILISDEVDPFKREIHIDPDATFLELLNTIYRSVNYTEPEVASFFICNEDWKKEDEITLTEQDSNPEYDNWIMDTTRLTEFLEDEQQRLVLQFDYPHDRYFFIELAEIITGKDIQQAKCTKSIGEAPDQYLIEEENFVPKVTKQPQELDVDESFYGDQDYDSMEIEGFENLDEL